MSTHPERPTPPPPYGIDPNRPQGNPYYPVTPVNGKARMQTSTRVVVVVSIVAGVAILLVIMALVTLMVMRASI